MALTDWFRKQQPEVKREPDPEILDLLAFAELKSRITSDNAEQTSYLVRDGRRHRINTQQLIQQYRETAYYCTNLNAHAVASVPLRLYVTTTSGQAKPAKILRTKRLNRQQDDYIRHKSPLWARDADNIEEVRNHPFLDLLRQPCKQPNGMVLLSQFDLLSVTQKYLEVTGKAFWWIDKNALGLPSNIWLVPSHLIQPKASENSENQIDYYEFRSNTKYQRNIPADEVLFFRNCSLDDPYNEGIGPLEAMLSRVRIESQYNLQTESMLANRARPDAIVSPSDKEGVLSEPVRKRLEMQFNSKYRSAGTGQVVFSADPIKIETLQFSARDLGELADMNASIEQIARAFDVPLSMINKDANRASAEEGRSQHAKDAVMPRLIRLQSVLNQMVSLYDSRLFVAFDNPVPEDKEFRLMEREINLKTGYQTINEYRAEEGLDPVEWGDKPWLPNTLMQPGEEQQPEPEPEPENETAADKAFRRILGRYTPEQMARYQAYREEIRRNRRNTIIDDKVTGKPEKPFRAGR